MNIFRIFVEGTYILISVGNISGSEIQGSERGHVTSPAVPQLPLPSAVRECHYADLCYSHSNIRYSGGYLIVLSCPFLINDNADHLFPSLLATGYSFKGLFSSFAQ